MNFRHTCPKDGAKSCCSGSKNIHADSFSCQSFRDGAMASPPMASPLSFFELFPSRETRESLPHRYSMLLTQPFCPSLPIVSYQWRGKFLRERSSRLSLSLYIYIYLSTLPLLFSQERILSSEIVDNGETELMRYLFIFCLFVKDASLIFNVRNESRYEFNFATRSRNAKDNGGRTEYLLFS